MNNPVYEQIFAHERDEVVSQVMATLTEEAQDVLNAHVARGLTWSETVYVIRKKVAAMLNGLRYDWLNRPDPKTAARIRRYHGSHRDYVSCGRPTASTLKRVEEQALKLLRKPQLRERLVAVYGGTMNPDLAEVLRPAGIDPDVLAEIIASQDPACIRIWNSSYSGALHTLNPKPTVWGCLCSEAGKRRPSPYVVRLHRRISKAAGARL